MNMKDVYKAMEKTGHAKRYTEITNGAELAIAKRFPRTCCLLTFIKALVSKDNLVTGTTKQFAAATGVNYNTLNSARLILLEEHFIVKTEGLNTFMLNPAVNHKPELIHTFWSYVYPSITEENAQAEHQKFMNQPIPVEYVVVKSPYEEKEEVILG